MPLGEIACRNRGAITVLNGGAENPLRFKHALGVMAQRSVAKIAESLFRRVYYLDNHDFTNIALSSAARLAL